MKAYSDVEAYEIFRAYNNGSISTSLDLVTDNTQSQSTSAIGRIRALNGFKNTLVSQNIKTSTDPLLLLIVGGMSVGKSTLLSSLPANHFLTPSGYASFLPEYAAFETYGGSVSAAVHLEYGEFVASHGGPFIRHERAAMKQVAIEYAAKKSCSVALESHPWLDEIKDLISVAELNGMRTQIIGIFDRPEWDANDKAITRARLYKRIVDERYLAFTHELMSQNWPLIAGLSENSTQYFAGDQI